MDVPGRRVLFFVPRLAGGGAERVTLALAAGFVAAGYECHLAVGVNGGELRTEVPSDVVLHVLGQERTARCVRSLAGLIRTLEPDALFSCLNHANVVAVAAAKLARRGTSIVVAEHIQLARYAGESSKWRDKAMPAFVRLAYRHANRVVAVSDGVAADLVRTGRVPPARIVTITNPVDVERIRRMAAVRPADPWFSHGPAPIVGVGRLTEQKAFDVLIEATALAASRREERRLVILGEGPERGNLEALAAKRQVELKTPGFVRNPYAYMSYAGVLAVSSRWEGLPLVIVEGMVLGVPIVSTDCDSGPRELLALDRGHESLVPVDDAHAMAAAIRGQRAEARPQPVDLPEAFTAGYAVRKYAEAAGLSPSDGAEDASLEPTSGDDH